MRIHIKICGITNPDDALLSEKSGASAVGFIFYPHSPRVVEPETAGLISDALGPFIARVGVFVDEDPGRVMDIVKTAHLTAVQLHGSESPDYVKSIKGVHCIKAFRVRKDFDPKVLGSYNSTTFLLDTYDESGYGGTGKTFDWDCASACKQKEYGRIILAGGLTKDNIRDAIRTVGPWGVDVSSGVEERPGKKDPEKLKAFFDSIKRELIK